MDSSWHYRSGAGSSRLDESTRRVLAAGGSAAYRRSAATTSTEPIRKSIQLPLRESAVGFRVGFVSGAAGIELGSLRRASRGRHPLSSDLSSIQLARLGELRRRRAWRHGRASDRSSVLGARTHLS